MIKPYTLRSASDQQATPVSQRQLAILRYIYLHIQERGYAPTLSEIGEANGILAKSAVSYQVKRLASRGYLERTGRASRSLVLLSSGYELLGEIPNHVLRLKLAELQQDNERLRVRCDQLQIECDELHAQLHPSLIRAS